MYVINDIAYSEDFNNTDLKIEKIKIVSELSMLVTFSSGEKRIFDAKYLLKYPIYEKLQDFSIFKEAYIENGIIVWNNGEIDIGVNEVYNNSFIYEQELVI